MSKKSKYLLYTAAGFIYSGFAFCIVKEAGGKINELMKGHEAYLISMNIIFLILTVLAVLKMNFIKKEAEKDPTKIFDMMYQMTYVTFLYATVYMLFNCAVKTVIPSGISDILMLRSLKINLPLSVLAVIAILAGAKDKKHRMKKIPLCVLAAAIIVAELSVSDIAVMILIAIVGKTGIFNSDSGRTDKFSLAVLTVMMISILTLVYLKTWILAAFSIALSAVVIFKEREQIKDLFRHSKLIKGAV